MNECEGTPMAVGTCVTHALRPGLQGKIISTRETIWVQVAWAQDGGVTFVEWCNAWQLKEYRGSKFLLGDRVTKTKGSSWTGLVVGSYSTALTPEGYCVESENEPGSVQIYPASALRKLLS